MRFKAALQRLANRRGYGFVAYPLARVVASERIDIVLDVGANRGQFGKELRRLGYKGKIVSFEPLPEPRAQLEEVSSTDPLWTVSGHALGHARERVSMNLAIADASSSILEPTSAMKGFAADAAAREIVEVEVIPLDEVFDDVVPSGARVLLKVDTQGYESAVLAGGERALENVDLIMLELSLIELYEGAPFAEVLIARLRERGFVPAWLYPAFWQQTTGRWLQADAVFVRESQGGSRGRLL